MFSFDPGSSIELLSSKIEKNVSPKYGAILPPAGHTITRADLKRIN